MDSKTIANMKSSQNVSWNSQKENLLKRWIPKIGQHENLLKCCSRFSAPLLSRHCSEEGVTWWHLCNLWTWSTNNIVAYNCEQKCQPFLRIWIEYKWKETNGLQPCWGPGISMSLENQSIPCQSSRIGFAPCPVLHTWNVVKCNAIKWEYVWCLSNFMWIVKQRNCQRTFE